MDRRTDFRITDERANKKGWLLKGHIVLPEDTDEDYHEIEHRFNNMFHLIQFLKRVLLP